MQEPQAALIGAEAMAIGPATRLFYTKSDVLGRVCYQVDNRPVRQVHFGLERSDAQWAVFDQILSAAFFHPPFTRLVALGSYAGIRPQIMLLGEQWGQIIDDRGQTRTVADPLEEFSRLRIPLCIGEEPHQIGIRFCMNIHFRDAYTGKCLRRLRPGKTHTLEIFFDTPSGDFVEALLVCQDRENQNILATHHLTEFPLRWADFDGMEPSPPQAAAGVPKPVQSYRRTLEPLADTLKMDDAQAIRAMHEESSVECRWEMIESNMDAGSPTRIYQMLCHFADLIGERMAHWERQRLVRALATQPGTLLVAVMSSWPLPTVMTLAEKSPEKDYIIRWLREREVERLLEMEPEQSLTTRGEAARWLGLPATLSGLDNKMVRDTWRRLLGFLNSDYGRGSEQAIHRKKDEIAKRLQQARDMLIKPN